MRRHREQGPPSGAMLYLDVSEQRSPTISHCRQCSGLSLPGGGVGPAAGWDGAASGADEVVGGSDMLMGPGLLSVLGFWRWWWPAIIGQSVKFQHRYQGDRGARGDGQMPFVV